MKYYCDNELEYRNYGIFDLSKSDKKKEDFWNPDEDCYEMWKFGNYLVEETDAMLSGKDVVGILNELTDKIIRLEDQKRYWMLATKRNSDFFDCLEKAVDESACCDEIWDKYAEYEKKVEL